MPRLRIHETREIREIGRKAESERIKTNVATYTPREITDEDRKKLTPINTDNRKNKLSKLKIAPSSLQSEHTDDEEEKDSRPKLIPKKIKNNDEMEL